MRRLYIPLLVGLSIVAALSGNHWLASALAALAIILMILERHA